MPAVRKNFKADTAGAKIRNMADIIRIKNVVLTRVMDRVLEESRVECCGLLAGKDGVITRVFAATNAMDSPTEYAIAPKELFQSMRKIRAAGLEFMGIYHSHPEGDNKPSARDIDQAYYPDVAYFILSPRKGRAKPIRAFSIRDGKMAELDVKVE
ncbi:MAG TPA: M67 family metallopeptidase [Candidatus Acidoferrales bacterium]|nr:M67 family metallopeptidase [Candidatus Acidoferrales bacterium]